MIADAAAQPGRDRVRSLALFAAGRRLGRLSLDADGEPILDYDPGWRATPGAYPISILMPLSEERWSGPPLAGWLRGLLPYGDFFAGSAPRPAPGGGDGEDLLARLAQMAADAPGAVSFGEPGDEAPGYRPISLDALLRRWPASPLLLDEPGVAHTLCEAQDDRLPVALLSDDDAECALALYGAPSTHLLWLEPPGASGALENRAFHLRLAAEIGLPAAGFRTVAASGRRLMLIERDDRERRGEGWARRHRETLAQALGAAPEQRFGREPDDPATLERIFLWADRVMPARERLMLLDAFLLHALIGATEGHALRFALHLQPQPALAPLMEIAGPGPVPAAERRFAQRVGGAARWPERIGPEHWRAFAEAARLNPTFTLDRLTALSAAIRERAASVVNALEKDPVMQPALLARFARETENRARAAAERLGRPSR